jgi:hypothetical protein
VKSFLTLALALCLHAQTPAGEPAPKSDAAQEAHVKAVKLVEITGARDKMAASLPDLVEKGKAAMRERCPECAASFITEWGKRMLARIKIDDFVDVAARAYEKRFTNDELSEFLAVVSSQKSDKRVVLSPALQKKVLDLLPGIMGEITGGSTEIGAKLGAEVGAEIAKEHPEYVPQPPKSDKP